MKFDTQNIIDNLKRPVLVTKAKRPIQVWEFLQFALYFMLAGYGGGIYAYLHDKDTHRVGAWPFLALAVSVLILPVIAEKINKYFPKKVPTVPAETDGVII